MDTFTIVYAAFIAPIWAIVIVFIVSRSRRFQLRSLMAVMTVAAIALAIVGALIRRYFLHS